MAEFPKPADVWMPQLDCGWRADIQPIMVKQQTGVWVHYSDYAAVWNAAALAMADADRRVADANKMAEMCLDLWRKATEKPATD